MKKWVLTMLCLWLLASTHAALIVSAQAEASEGGWQYRWGDSPLDDSGLPIWTDAAANGDKDWTTLSNINDIGKKQSNSIWYRFNLDNIHCDEICSIKISRIFQNYEVYVNRKLIYQFGEMDNPDQVMIQGRTLNQISFPKDQKGYVYYRIHSGIARIGLEGKVILGEQDDVMMHTVKSSILSGILTVLSVVVGIILLIFSALNKQRLMLVSGLFILLMGIYTFLLSDVKYLLFPHHDLLFYQLKILEEYILSTLISLTYQSLWGKGYKGINRWVSVIFAIELMVYFVYSLINLTAAQTLFTYFNISVVLSSTYFFINALIKYVKHRNYETTMLVFATFSVVITCAHDALRAVLLFKTNQIIPWGLSTFMVFLCAIFVKRFYDVHVELQHSNKRLDELHSQKDQIFANTSHELRTPLTGIIGLAESLMSDANANMKTSLEIIVSSGRRLSKLINDILDVSSIKNKTVELWLKPVNVYATAETVIALSQPLIGNRMVDISNKIGPLTVLADEDRLQQIFHNLLSNAIKFTEQGCIELSSFLESDKVVISVKDTGIGIPQDKLSVIFNPFEQVDGSLARKYGGTGLGLHVTKQLVELHGGTLTVESQLGQYTAFSFNLPLFDQEVAASLSTDSTAQFHQLYPSPIDASLVRTTGKVNILVVDDEVVNLQVLYNLLTPNYGVTVAHDGKQALEWVKQEEFDLIVLDVMMPGLTGFDVCGAIRESYSQLALPVILISAYSTSEHIANGFKQGANEYITKPFIKQEILTRIDAQLKLKFVNEAKNILSEKEKEVLRMFETGKERSAIREALFISESTLKNHITKINKKLGTKTIQEAADQARKEKMI
ncbi:response regulator [Paenibacillus athensensis]|uniref:Circadian input-output histidine kinase CikA n=1 Tax=Paenibacillus athensensis TaxID=1967502 RepID=A0A4Y8Q5C5_9BACL|nr:ATP-binding protein [Paenibacillus athensensis]MCD1259241.1 response regulator [Paenibacillus athensensis]